MRWQLLTRNVTEAADPPKENTVARPMMRTWSAETLRSFLSACEGDRKQLAWLLLASTGMRRGEVLGLSWDDVDLETAQLAVRRTVVAVRSPMRPTPSAQPRSTGVGKARRGSIAERRNPGV